MKAEWVNKWWGRIKKYLPAGFLASEDQKVDAGHAYFAQEKRDNHFPCVKQDIMDYTQIKKILLAEYQANGGKNTSEFLRGMNYLEDYLESGRKDHSLNAHVDELMFLRSRVERLEKDVVELERTLKHKQNVIKQYRQMNKDEKYKWKSSQELTRLEMVYSRMVMELEDKYKRKRFKHKPGTTPTYVIPDKPAGRKISKAG